MDHRVPSSLSKADFGSKRGWEERLEGVIRMAEEVVKETR
jgi:hypothetical protein